MGHGQSPPTDQGKETEKQKIIQNQEASWHEVSSLSLVSDGSGMNAGSVATSPAPNVSNLCPPLQNRHERAYRIEL